MRRGRSGLPRKAHGTREAPIPTIARRTPSGHRERTGPALRLRPRGRQSLAVRAGPSQKHRAESAHQLMVPAPACAGSRDGPPFKLCLRPSAMPATSRTSPVDPRARSAARDDRTRWRPLTLPRDDRQKSRPSEEARRTRKPTSTLSQTGVLVVRGCALTTTRLRSSSATAHSCLRTRESRCGRKAERRLRSA